MYKGLSLFIIVNLCIPPLLLKLDTSLGVKRKSSLEEMHLQNTEPEQFSLPFCLKREVLSPGFLVIFFLAKI